MRPRLLHCACADATYLVKDSDLDQDYDTSSPKRCPGGNTDYSPYINAAYRNDAGKAVLTFNYFWEFVPVLYGYKVALKVWDIDSEQYDAVPDWSSKLLRTYQVPSLPLGLLLSDGLYELTFDYPLEGSKKYQVDIYYFYLDGRQSPVSTWTIEALP
jgi:hypothetical protein